MGLIHGADNTHTKTRPHTSSRFFFLAAATPMVSVEAVVTSMAVVAAGGGMAGIGCLVFMEREMFVYE